MTVLELHDNDCFKFAKGVLKTNIDTPILVKSYSNYGVNYLSCESIEIVYLIEFNGIFKYLMKAERLQKVLADGSLLGQKEEIELRETSTGLEVKDTDIEHLEQSYSALAINAVPLYL